MYRFHLAGTMEAGEKKRPFVTEVRIQLTQKPPILAFASVTLWGAIVVHDLRLLQRRDGSRVVLMPRLKGPDGVWSPVAHPVREDARKRIEECVIHAFEDLTARRLSDRIPILPQAGPKVLDP